MLRASLTSITHSLHCCIEERGRAAIGVQVNDIKSLRCLLVLVHQHPRCEGSKFSASSTKPLPCPLWHSGFALEFEASLATWCFLYPIAVWMEPWVSCMLGKCFNAELNPIPFGPCYLISSFTQDSVTPPITLTNNSPKDRTFPSTLVAIKNPNCESSVVERMLLSQKTQCTQHLSCDDSAAML